MAKYSVSCEVIGSWNFSDIEANSLNDATETVARYVREYMENDVPLDFIQEASFVISSVNGECVKFTIN